jgi:hypothetical protein
LVSNNPRRGIGVATRPPHDDRAQVASLIDELTTARRAATSAEVASLRQYFATVVLPWQPTARVYAKHAKHV